MRRDFLPPPRSVEAQTQDFASAGPAVQDWGESVARRASGLREQAGTEQEPAAIRPTAGGHQPLRGRLPGPSAATPRLRRWFDPRRGWFRRIERDLSHILSLHVYPWIPGIHRLYGAQIERSLTVSEAQIRIAGLPRGFEGMNILLISDIHTGPFLSRRALQRAFNRLLTLEPDMILLGGDLTTCQISEIVPSLPAFRSLIAPLGTYAVLGNHDHYAGDPQRMRELLESVGIRVLHNSSVTLERGGGRVILAGIDDLYQGQPDLAAALSADHRASDDAAASRLRDALERCVVPAVAAHRAEREEAAMLEPALASIAGAEGPIRAGGPRDGSAPSTRSRTEGAPGSDKTAGADGEASRSSDADRPADQPAAKLQERPASGGSHERSPVILLSHNPDILFEASAQGVDLVLAGHTHGGQIRIPGLPVLVRQSRYRLDEGRYVVNGTELVVSRGLGVSGIPLRIACTPEAVLLQLRAR